MRITDRLTLTRAPFRRQATAGFSLIEMLVTVGLLTFIILGLLAMFSQTQRAFKSSITQTDVLEAGRATTDLMVRDLEQMQATHCPVGLAGNVWYEATNFFAEIPLSFNQPLLQDLPGSTVKRVNTVQRFFLMSQANQDWVGIGYQVIPEYVNAGVGTLYRFSATNRFRDGPMTVSAEFLNAPLTNLNRIAEGVVHLRVRAYATNGCLVTTNALAFTNGFALNQVNSAGFALYGRVQHTVVCTNGYDFDQAGCYFMSNAVPAYVELELGILEPQVLQRWRAIGSSTPDLQTAQRQYLADQAARVHLFRQRIPIRSVDFSAYQ